MQESKLPPAETNSVTKDKSLKNNYLAASWIHSDRKLLVFWLLILAAPTFVANFIGLTREMPLTALVSFLTKMLEFSFLSFVFSRHIKPLKSFQHQGEQSSVKNDNLVSTFFNSRIFLISILYWLIGPSFAADIGALTFNTQQIFVYLFYFTICLYLGYRYFFVCFTYAFSNQSLKSAMISSSQIISTDYWLPLKVLTPAFVIYFLLWNLVLTPAPDMRIFELVLVSTLFEPIYIIIATYLYLDFGLRNAPKTLWSEPPAYLEQRLDTLRTTAPNFLCKAFELKTAAIVAITGICLFLANQVKVFQTPPAAKIEINSFIANDELATLTLSLHDPAYSLRGFSASLLHISGENRTMVCNQILNIAKAESPNEPLKSGILSSEKISLIIQYRCLRKAEDLAALKDLHLWYAATKLLPLPPASLSPSPTPSQTTE